MKKLNNLKFRLRINKHDKLEPKGVVYVAVVNGFEHQFTTKIDLVNYLDTYRHHFNEIRDLQLYRIDTYSLIDENLIEKTL